MTSESDIIIHPFDQIPLRDWYAISQLRQQVFVVEQKCAYQDADGKDIRAYHLYLKDNHRIVAYARIVNPADNNVSEENLKFIGGERLCSNLAGEKQRQLPAIGRVVLHPSLRGRGISKTLMQKTVVTAQQLYPDQPIFLSAQKALRDFYTDFGFIQSGPGYLEDGIPHIPMILYF